MLAVGRRRTKNHGCPAGVREIEGRWYWQPTKATERAARKAAGLPASVPLGKADSLAARRKWAELTGLREGEAEPGTVGDLLARFYSGPIKTRRNGKPRSDATVKQYRWRRRALEQRFADCAYGRTELDVLRGRGVSPGQMQAFITASGSLGRAYLAVLDAAFDHAILDGLTVYNPCDKVMAPAGNARTREPLEWEIEALCAMATPVVALILALKNISGYRISEVLRLQRRDLTAAGIRVTTKGAKRELLLWSPGLREIAAAADRLPGATLFPASPLFPHSRGKAYTYNGWFGAWSKLLAATNAALAEDGPLAIDDLHVHDLRSKVHDDAEAMGREGHEQLGNTEAVADRHYSRREKRRRPLR